MSNLDDIEGRVLGFAAKQSAWIAKHPSTTFWLGFVALGAGFVIGKIL